MKKYVEKFIGFIDENKVFVILAFMSFLSAWAFDATSKPNTTGAAILALMAVITCGGWLYYKKQLTVDKLLTLIIAAGFIMRLEYVLYTPLYTRQHDIGPFGNMYGGHSSYIEWFYYNHFALIDEDPTTIQQFYHPPLHHFLASIWMRVLTRLGMPLERAQASVPYLTLFYSSCCMPVAERIFRKLGLKKKGLILGVALIAFHPTFILLAASFNNDILSILFIFLAIYATICWYKKPTLLNIIGIALSVGLGMMTKLSVAVVAPPIAIIFLIKIFTNRKDLKWFKYLKQYIVFGCICVPLGLWYEIRNYVRYGVPLTYVWPLESDSSQYIGFYTVWERLFDFSKKPFANIFLNRPANGSDFYEYNPVVAIIKTSCFGEWAFGTGGIYIFCKILLFLNIIMIFVALCATVYFLCRKNSYLDYGMKIFIGGYYILLIIQYFYFCFVQIPQCCGMDFRYIVPTVLVGALFMGILVEGDENESIYALGGGQSNAVRILRRVVTLFTLLLSAVFCLFSVIVYLMLGA